MSTNIPKHNPLLHASPQLYSVSKYAPPPLHLRQSLQRQYISSEASEQDLFSRVQRKLAGRKTSEVRLVRFM